MGTTASGVCTRPDEGIIISGGTILQDIQEIIRKNEDKAGGLIRILQQVQEMFDYLPAPIVRYLSQELRVPLSELYGIISFYGFFSMVPKGKHVVQVCLGTSCYVKGGKKILDVLKKDWSLEPGGITEDRRFSLETVRCLGCCGLSPVIAIDGTVHGKVKHNKLDEIMNFYS